MSPQFGFDGHLGMAELVVTPHSEPFHHGTRFEIGDGGKCDNFFQMELCETERDSRLRSLRGIAQAPIGFGEAPSHFNAG